MTASAKSYSENLVTAANLTLSVSRSTVVCAEDGNPDLIDGLADEWRELCLQSENDEPFYRPEWIRAYLRAFAPAARVLVITVRIQGCLQLVLPLIKENTTLGGVPVRTLRAPANSHPGRFDFVCRRGPGGEAAIRSAWTCLKELKGWDLLELRNVPENGAAGRLAEIAQADGMHTLRLPERPNPCIPVPDSSDASKIRPRNTRLGTKLRHIRRELGDLNFFCLETPTCEALDRFYELEGSGWKGQEQSAIKNSVRTLSFYNDVAESASKFHYFALYMLEWNGELMAAHFSLLHRGRCYSPKVAYNEKFDHFAPGHLIVEEILRDCAMRGVRTFDITGPDDEWKLKWTSQVRGMNHHYVFRRGLGSLAGAVRFELRPTLGRLVRSLRGG